MKVWDFDIAALAASTNKDSIFYLNDLTTSLPHVPAATGTVINAFRLVHADVLPRNLTIACGKPVYIQGSFNKWDAGHDTANYKNAQIAGDAVSVLSSAWPNWAADKIGVVANVTDQNSSLEQPFDGLPGTFWTSCAGCATIPGLASSAPTGLNLPASRALGSGSVRINAAMVTGNRPSSSACLAGATNDAAFEACYEGGWHNSLRFLEDWGGSSPPDTVLFKGSFVCLWEASTPGLTLDPAAIVIRRGHYKPPTRVWGFDTRFTDLANMPPGTPYLSTGLYANWSEPR